MWLCHDVGVPVLQWASPVDQSGHYGLTHVECTEVKFGPGGAGPLSLVRALLKIAEVLGEL
jgi:hypothetical protein